TETRMFSNKSRRSLVACRSHGTARSLFVDLQFDRRAGSCPAGDADELWTVSGCPAGRRYWIRPTAFDAWYATRAALNFRLVLSFPIFGRNGGRSGGPLNRLAS